jgi:SAM-dependent methyltransferase
MTETAATGAYVLDNAWEHARSRLAMLERVYDPASIRRLQAVGVGPGWHCLEVGAGGGSITRWLCSQVGETGRVRAVDLDTRFVEEIEAANLEVARVDLTTEELPRAAYDLVHTRCVLVHLASREVVLDGLIASLRPGGWLLLEEADDFAVAAIGSGLHAEALGKVNAGATAAGVNLSWPRHLPGLLHGRGLHDVGIECEVPLVEGGSPGAECLRLTGIQLRDQAIAAGATPEQLDEWDALLRTPGQWFPAWAMVAAWGRRP